MTGLITKFQNIEKLKEKGLPVPEELVKLAALERDLYEYAQENALTDEEVGAVFWPILKSRQYSMERAFQLTKEELSSVISNRPKM